MTSWTIRRAAATDDIATLRLLMAEYATHLAQSPARISIPNFTAELGSLPGPYTVLLLAEAEGEPAGCVALKAVLRPNERACEMKRLYIRDRFRHRGLGRGLVLSAIDHAVQDGYTAIYLDTVASAMPEANRLYLSLGFQPVDRYNDNPVADVIFFRLSLPPLAQEPP